MIEFSPIDLAIFSIASFLVISGTLLAIIAVWNLMTDYMDGTIRKRPGTKTLRGLFKGNDRA